SAGSRVARGSRGRARRILRGGTRRGGCILRRAGRGGGRITRRAGGSRGRILGGIGRGVDLLTGRLRRSPPLLPALSLPPRPPPPPPHVPPQQRPPRPATLFAVPVIVLPPFRGSSPLSGYFGWHLLGLEVCSCEPYPPPVRSSSGLPASFRACHCVSSRHR